MVVDYQSHWYPPAYLDSIEGRDRSPRTERTEGGYRFEGMHDDRRLLEPRFFDLDIHLQSMDEHGIDVMVCSPNLVGDVCAMEVSEAREATELLNEELSRAQREHPDRFVGLAMLPMQDTEAALTVLERAISELQLRGVCILTHINGRAIAGEETLPVYQRIADLGVPIFLHPTHRSSIFRPGNPRPLEAGLNWVYDTSQAALSLILGGVLDTCPTLEVIHPHGGGVLPYVIGRIASTTRRNATVLEQLPPTERPIEEYLRERFYADSVVQTPGALRLALEIYGADRILFGTDFPWQERGRRVAYVEENVAPEQAQRIMHDNAPAGMTLPSARAAGNPT